MFAMIATARDLRHPCAGALGGMMDSSKTWPAWRFAVLIVLSLPSAASIAVRCAEAIVRMSGGVTDPLEILKIVGALLIASFGALVLARGRNNRAAAYLGAILIALATQVAPSVPLIEMDARAMALLLVIALRSGIISYLWPLFALEISGGPTSRSQRRVIAALSIVFALLPIAALWNNIADRDALAAVIWTFLVIGNQALGYWILIGNYRRNDAAGRNRIKIAFVAFVLFTISSMMSVFISAGVPSVEPLVPAFALGATALLAYATLRHRLFDFGFVLNRTLVYAVLSFILLLAFGLAEWAAEHLIPEAWHEGGPLVSVGIALALFLSFHRLRDWVEQHVERLLFSKWHKNEAMLRRFIGASDHFGSGAALQKAFVAELARFTAGAAAALYLRAGDGGFALAAGKLGKAARRFADDDRALALMRAEREPVDLTRAHSSLPGSLALPMLDQGALLGFVLLGPKPDGAPYRPDELAVLGWAAQQVGFAAQAQHVRQLEETIAELRAQLGARAARATAAG